MSTLAEFTVHPFADKFPLLQGDDFAELVEDVRSRGLQQPIVLTHDRKVLVDGRNRLRACDESHVDPVFDVLGDHYTDEMIVDYIISSNLKRRHLTIGQKSFIGLEYEAYFAEATPEPKRGENGRFTGVPVPAPRSVDKAAAVVGVGKTAISQAKAIQRDAPDLADEVRAGRLALDAADKQRKQREAARPKPEKEKPTREFIVLRTHEGDEVQYPKPSGKSTFNKTAGEGISWAAWSWNPVTGCLHGCKYCYARELATKSSYETAYPVGFTPLFHAERLSAPENTPVPQGDNPADRRVFVCSMADLYGNWVPDEWIDQVHEVCMANPQWQYLFLTKYPKRYLQVQLPRTAWVGTSVDEQKRVRLAEDSFRSITDVAVKWLSLEPLREPLEFSDLSMFDWIVIGAQTQTIQPWGAEPEFAPPFEWIARLVSQAREAGCKVHLKPNLLGKVGPQLPGMALPDEYPVPNL